MNRMTFFAVIVLAVTICGSTRVAEGDFISAMIDFSEHHNVRMQEFMTGTGFASEYPEGLVTLGGVPFAIPEGGLNTWSAGAAMAATPYAEATIDIHIGVFGAVSTHLLLTTHKGEQLPGTFAMLEFFGSEGAYFVTHLDGNDDIRDWLYSSYTNTINGLSTINVFTAGSGLFEEYRLDMLTVELPSAFRTQALSTVRVTDSGNYELQRLNIHGITVSAVPEPSTLTLGMGLMVMAALSFIRRRRTVATWRMLWKS